MFKGPVMNDSQKVPLAQSEQAVCAYLTFDIDEMWK